MLHSWGRGLMTAGGMGIGAGAGIFAGLFKPVQMFAEHGTELHHASKELGLTVENLDALAKIGHDAGVPFEDLEKALFGMEKNLGGGKAGEALQRLGINIADLQGQGGTDTLANIVDALAQMSDQFGAAAAAQEIFGRGGRRMLGMARETAGGLKALIAEKKKDGVMSEEDAKQAEEFTKGLKKLESTASRAAMAVGGELVKAMMEYKEPVLAGAKAIGEFVREHKGLAVTVAGIGAGLIAGGAAMMGIGGAISGLGTALGALATVAGVLFSPAGLLVAGAAALVVLWARTADGKEVVKSLAADWKDAFSGMVAAVKTGDFEAAFKIVTKGIEITWVEMWANLRKAYNDFLRGMNKNKGAPGESSDVTANDLVNIEEQVRLGEAWAANKAAQLFVGITGNSEGLNEKARKILEEAQAKIRAETAGTRNELAWMDKNDPNFSDDAKLKKLRNELAALTGAARTGAIEKKIDFPKEVGPALAAGLAQAAKGTFSGYGVQASFGIGDTIGQRIAGGVEKTVEVLQQMPAQIAERMNAAENARAEKRERENSGIMVD
jgi:hypothetical protein